MPISTNTIEAFMDIPECMTPEGIREVVLEDECLRTLADLDFCGWHSTNAEVQEELQPHWSFRDEIGFTDGIAVGRYTYKDIREGDRCAQRKTGNETLT